MHSWSIRLVSALMVSGVVGGASAAESKSVPAKIPADAKRITEMLRDKFGPTVADAVRVTVKADAGGVTVKLRGELPDEKIRRAVTNEVSERVQGLQLEDFAIEVAGPVRLLHTLPVKLEQDVPAAFSQGARYAALLEREFSQDTFEIWDLAARRRLNRPNAHDFPRIRSLAMSADGRWVATGHDQDALVLWRLPYGEERVVVKAADPAGHGGGSVKAAALSSDARYLASVSDGSPAKLWLWDLAGVTEAPVGKAAGPVRGRMLAEMRSIGGTWFLAFSPDGKTLAAAAKGDQQITLWDTAAREVRTTLKAEKLAVEHLAWSPDGKTLAAGRLYENGALALYEVAGGAMKALPLPGDRDLVEALAFSPDGRTLAGRIVGSGLVLWDLAAGKPWQIVEGNRSGRGSALAFADGGTSVITDFSSTDLHGLMRWDVSARPGLVAAAAGPVDLGAVPAPRDDHLREAVRRFAAGTIPGGAGAAAQVEILADGSIRLFGTVPDKRTVEDVARNVFIRFCRYRDDDDPPRKVINDMKAAQPE